MNNNESSKVNKIVRDELVNTAVNFLRNPKVSSTPLKKKQEFLKRKGLTNDEIERACEISGAYLQQLRANPTLAMALNRDQIQPSFLHPIKEILQGLAVFSVLGYSLYKLYEGIIVPFLFGRKKKTVDESIEILDKNMKKSIADIKIELESMKVEVEHFLRKSESINERHISDLKSDISTLRGLLLGRKQFPSMSHSPVVPPSIPAWQMSSEADASDGDADHKTEDIEEIGYGSGSSEPEHCTKTSESSLEILSLPKDCKSSAQHPKDHEQ